MQTPRALYRWSNFSIRTLLLLAFGVAVTLGLYLSKPVFPTWAMFMAVAIYFTAWMLPGASYGFDVCPHRRGLLGGAVVGALVACTLAALMSTVAIADGHYDVFVSVRSDGPVSVAGVSYMGLPRRDMVPFVIEHFSANERDFTIVPDPNGPFAVAVGFSIRSCDFPRIEWGYGQQHKALLLRVEFDDGTHVFQTITLPTHDQPREVVVTLEGDR